MLMRKHVDKRHFVVRGLGMHYFDAMIYNYSLYVLNDTSSSYILLSIVFTKELGLKFNLTSNAKYKVVNGTMRTFASVMDKQVL